VSSKNDDKEIKDMINSQLYKYQNFMLIAKHNQRSNDQTRVDYLVQKVTPMNRKEANKGYLDMLKAYHQIEVLMSD